MRDKTRSSPVATTRNVAISTSTPIRKGCGSLAILLMFLFAAMTNANAAATNAKAKPMVATTTTTTLTAGLTTAPTVAITTASYGVSVTLTATVSSSTAAGTMTFYDGTDTLGSPVTVSAGKATLATTALALGANSLTAVFTPTTPTAFTTSTSAAKTITVSQATTTTTLVAGLSTAPTVAITAAPYGAGVTLTATVSPSTAAGTVTFNDGTTALGSPVAVSSGTATLTTTSLALGANSLTAVFTPTTAANFTSSTSTAKTVTVSVATTTTTLAVGLTSAPTTAITTATYGASVTLTATLVPAASAGTVTFKLGTATLGSPVTVSSGTATLATTALALGANSLTAVFTPTTPADFTTSTSTAKSVTVSQATTTTTLAVGLTSAPNTPITTANLGASVTLTATLSPSAAAGTVTFKLGTATLGSPVAVSSGTATLATTALALGANSLTAVFTPTTAANFTTSTSAAKTVTVSQPVATTTLAVSAGPHYYGGSVLLTATVTPSTATAGTVTFYDNSVSLGTGTLTSGTFQLSVSTLTVGTHPITATYAGDASYSNGTSASTSVSVVASATHAAIAAGPATENYGSNFTLTATVTPTVGSATVSAGNVTFYDSSVLLGKATVSGGTATLSSSNFPTPPAVGKHYYIASYGGVYNSGTAEFSTSLSSAAQVTITGAAQTITFAAPASATYGASPVALVATADSSLPVTFTASGACSVSSGTLTYTSAGTCTVTASQAGNISFAAATPVINTVTVSPALLTITASSPSISYGATAPAITASYSGFIGADTKYTGLTTRPTCSITGYTLTSDPGSFVTSCTGAVGANYTFNYVAGSVTVGKASQTINNWFSSSASAVYGATVTLSATATSGQPVSYTLTGPATISGNTLTATGVGTVVVTAQQSGNTEYTAANPVSNTVKIYPSPLVVTAGSPTVSYGASVPTITATYVGFVNSDTSSSLTTQPTCFTAYSTTSAPGSSNPTICYGVVDSNYDITYAPGSVVVIKATPVVSSWPTASTITYGQTLSSSTLTGGASDGTFAWASSSLKPGAGTPSESVIFTPTNTTDYTTATGPVSVTVNQATPTVSVPPTAAAITYGQALSASRLSGGTTSTPGTFSWVTSSTVPATMGVNSESVTFTPTDSVDYTTATSTANVTVNKATPIITWPTASAITFGQALSNSILSGGTSPGGTFAWSSPNAIPGAGTPYENVTFTPTNATEYLTATHPVIVTVNKAPSTVSVWPTASTITYGQPLSSSKLTGGTASANGTFAWTNPTTIPGAGTPSESVTFTPTSATNNGTTTGSVTVTVNQATPTVSVWPTASPITSSQTLNSSNLTGGTTDTPGTFAWTDSTIVPGVGTTSYNVTFSPSDSADYVTESGWVSVPVNVCGKQDSTNSSFSTALNAYTADTTLSNAILDVEGNNESAICAVNSSPTDNWTVAVSYPSITSGAGSTFPADSSSYGTNAAVLAYGTDAVAGHGATITITDDGSGDPGSITTANDYSNGVFASMGGTVNITNANINTFGTGAHALDATYAGTLSITNVTASTYGANSSVILAGIGGGNVTVAGGTFTSNGSRSAGIRAAGTGSLVAVSNSTITAQNGSAVVVEGGNTVQTIGTALFGALGDDHGIFLYEGTNGNSGDATVGTSTFTMTNGSISYTCDATSISASPCPVGSASSNQNNPATLFSVANTTAAITLTDVIVVNTTPTDANSNGTLLTASALNSGTTGSNGGIVTFNANGETLAGDIIVDSISSVNLSLAADTAIPSVPSTLIGAINSANSGGTAILNLDATSSWVVTGNSHLTTLNNAVVDNSNITCFYPGQCSVYVGTTLLSGVN